MLKREFDTTGNPAIAEALNQQNRLITRQAAGKGYGNARGRNRTTKRPGLRRNFASPEGFNECGVTAGRPHAAKVAERMEQKQKGFPDIMRHPTTIGIAILRMTANVAEEINQARPRLRNACSNLTHGYQVSGGFTQVHIHH